METKIPFHVAIIPDGNRRWAANRDLLPWQGHEAGAKNTEHLIRAAQELGIRELSFWGSSLENLTKRSLEEKAGLLKVYLENFKALLSSKEIGSGLVRVRFIGRFQEVFPKPLLQLIADIEERTKKNTEYFLNFFLAYSGDDDMLSAIEKLVDAGKKKLSKVDVKEALMTRELAPVDYLIRTGGDPHLSTGFMMWDTANAELFFTDTLFPDFNAQVFSNAIEEFSNRARRGGK